MIIVIFRKYLGIYQSKDVWILEMIKSAEYILNLKANKKMVQNYFLSSTGKRITMKIYTI